MSQICPNCGEAIIEKSIVNSETGDENTELLDLDGKFHMCAKPRPVQKPAIKPVAKKPVEKKHPNTDEIKKSIATETKALAYENACDALATSLKMKYYEVDAIAKQRSAQYKITALQALEGLAMEKGHMLSKILGMTEEVFRAMIDTESKTTPVINSVPEKPTPPAIPLVVKPPAIAPYTNWDECRGCNKPSWVDAGSAQCKICDEADARVLAEMPDPAQITPQKSMVIRPGKTSLIVDEEDEAALDQGIEVPFDDAIERLTRSLLSVEKASKDKLVLHLIKAPVIKRRSKFEQDEKDEKGEVVFETDDAGNIIQERDEKTGKMKPKVKKYRMINYWFVCQDNGGNEYLLNVNKGMQKSLAMLKREPNGLENWFTLRAEGSGKSYKVMLTITDQKGLPIKKD